MAEPLLAATPSGSNAGVASPAADEARRFSAFSVSPLLAPLRRAPLAGGTPGTGAPLFADSFQERVVGLSLHEVIQPASGAASASSAATKQVIKPSAG